MFRTVVASLAVAGFLAASVLSGCEQHSEGLISKEQAAAVAMEAFAERPAVIPSTMLPVSREVRI